jgi:saccharopine dehydrogenase (NAD+, L-lysine-forming)
MNVLLIGSGAVGSVIAKHLAASSRVKNLTLADINLQRAISVATQVEKRAKAEVSVLYLDASNALQLKSALKDMDLVINAALPRFNLIIMNAALECGCNYLDLAMLDKSQYHMHEDWERERLTAVVGFGEDPGISNMAAKLAADLLDRVESIRIRDGDNGSSKKYPFSSSFSPETFFGEVFDPPLVFKNGRYIRESPLSGREAYSFPLIGRMWVYYVDHEEVYTLPKNIGKGVRNVDFKLALTDETLNYLLALRDIGLLSKEEITVGKSRVRPFDVVLRLVPQPSSLLDLKGVSCVVIEVEGVDKRGKVKRHKLFVAMSHEEAYTKHKVNATSYLTGVGAAAGALLMLSGNRTPYGVLSPEELDAKRYFEILKELGVCLSHLVSDGEIVTQPKRNKGRKI